jgi:pSer/pThr/pTyr-binding forkhead associated (FHA) protein
VKVSAADSKQLVLCHRGAMTALTRTGLVIGRGLTCDVLLDDAAVSRRHARVALLEAAPTVEDLGSANGVFVNGRRVEGKQQLAAGDVIVIGPGVFRVQLAEGVAPHKKKKRVSTIDQLWDESLEPPPPAATEIADALALAARGAAELIREGRVEAAEQVLEPQLAAVLERARSGKLPSGTSRAARLALELALRSRKQRWLEYVLDLYEGAGSVPSPAVGIALFETMRVLDATGLPRLDAYLATMQQRALDDETRGRLTDFVTLYDRELRRNDG